MNSYDVIYQKTPDWTKVPKFTLDVANWKPNPGIKVEVQIAWNEDKLMYHAVAHEKNIRAVHQGPGKDVCEDSCLEFFFMPEDAKHYVNFECNPNRAIWLGVGTNMPDRIRLMLQDETGILNIRTNRTDDGWELYADFPIAFLHNFYPDYELKEGNILKVNCMKCGDLTQDEHYLSWNAFDPDNLTFHDSKFFGKMKLVK